MRHHIRDLVGMEDMQECERIQKEVWGFCNLDVVPAGLVSVMGNYGAISAGAFVGDRMAGFVSGFPAFDGGEPFHHSHMLAVRREYRGAGLGIALKWAQADRVRERGIRRINWTFDPLQAPNANLNINRLGCLAWVYRLNVYGHSQSPLHGGIPTDRLEPEWLLDTERVRRARRNEGMPPPGIPELPGINRVQARKDGLPESTAPVVPGGSAPPPEVLLFIPPRIREILKADVGLAVDWRLKTRAAFTALFELGYQVTAFHRDGDRTAYRLLRAR